MTLAVAEVKPPLELHSVNIGKKTDQVILLIMKAIYVRFPVHSVYTDLFLFSVVNMAEADSKFFVYEGPKRGVRYPQGVTYIEGVCSPFLGTLTRILCGKGFIL